MLDFETHQIIQSYGENAMISRIVLLIPLAFLCLLISRTSYAVTSCTVKTYEVKFSGVANNAVVKSTPEIVSVKTWTTGQKIYKNETVDKKMSKKECGRAGNKFMKHTQAGIDFCKLKRKGPQHGDTFGYLYKVFADPDGKNDEVLADDGQACVTTVIPDNDKK